VQQASRASKGQKKKIFRQLVCMFWTGEIRSCRLQNGTCLRLRVRNGYFCFFQIQHVRLLWIRTVTKYNALNTEDEEVEPRLHSPGSFISQPPSSLDFSAICTASSVLQNTVGVIRYKVKQYLYIPGEAPRVPGGLSSQISRQSAHEGGKVDSPTHRPPLPTRKYSWYSFLLEAELKPGP
jgi:hypothetical protein